MEIHGKSMTDVSVAEYTSLYRQAFRAHNEAWITKYFELEEEDHHILNDPGKIIREGGYILVALLEEEAVGVCALRKWKTFKYKSHFGESAEISIFAPRMNVQSSTCVETTCKV